MRADARANYQELVEAAWRLFADQGPNMSLRSVAAEAGVGIGTLYRHFPNREALIAGIAAEVTRRIENIVITWCENWNDDPVKSWEGFVNDFASLQLGNLVFQGVPEGKKLADLVKSFDDLRSENLENLDSVLSLAKRDGLVDAEVSSAQFFVGLGVVTRPVPVQIPEEIHASRSWLINTFIRGLRPL